MACATDNVALVAALDILSWVSITVFKGVVCCLKLCNKLILIVEKFV